MPSPREVQLWAQTGDIVTALEKSAGRETLFLQLFLEQLDRLAVDPEAPMVTEIIAARRAAQALWMLDRNTRNGAHYARHVEKEVSRVQARGAMFAELDLGYRISNACMANLKFVDDLLLQARGELATLRAAHVPQLEEVG